MIDSAALAAVRASASHQPNTQRKSPCSSTITILALAFPPRNVSRMPYHADLFSSPRCKVAISCTIVFRDAPAQASLDPAACKIAYREAPDLHDPQASLKSVVIERLDGDFLLAVAKPDPDGMARASCLPRRRFEANGLRLLERDAADIRREPFSPIRAQSGCTKATVSPTMTGSDRRSACRRRPAIDHRIEERARPARDILDILCARWPARLLWNERSRSSLGPRTMVRGR